jgi:DHA2 family multidrug resistance protein
VLALVLVKLIVPKTSAAEERRKSEREGLRFDVIGFVLVATFLGALEVVLDRGQEDDWFSSGFIVTFAVICAVAFVLMIPWELTRKDPLVDFRMMAQRQFATCFAVMLLTGAILIATTQFLPLLVQQDFGYTATWAGLALSPGGVVTMMMMIVNGRLLTFVQPKWLIATGGVIVAGSMYGLTSLYSDVNFWFFALSRISIGVGLPLMLVPVLTASYAGVPAEKTDQASALMSAARNIGGSIGISIGVNVLAHREQFHQSRLVESVSPSAPAYQDAVQKLTSYFLGQGSALAQAKAQAVQWIGQQVQLQASLLAYIDVFWTLMLLALVTVPLALFLRNIQLGRAAAAE